MKPDWQNKSYAKGGAATGPSTMHPKLKVGMSSLHSKIGMANTNMPQAPKPVAKPAVRKFADGGFARGGGVMSDEDYAKQMEQGEKNMERLRSAADTIKSFFSKDKGADTSASNVTGDSGMSASDTAKKQAMSGGVPMAAAEPEKTRQISDYMSKAPASEEPDYGNEGRRTSMATASSSMKAKPAPKAMKAEPAVGADYGNEGRRTPMAASKAEAPAKPNMKTYRTPSGKIETYQETEKPSLDVTPYIKKGAGAVVDYFKNFETPAERRSRLAKEGK